MVRHHLRIAPAIGLTLALFAAAPAAARPQLNPLPAAHSTASMTQSVCSEVCSVPDYGAATPVTVSSAGAVLPHDPRPRPEVLASSTGTSSTNRAVTTAAGTQPAAVHVASSSSGFHWGDAGIGAGAAVAITLLVLGGLLIVSNSRRHGARASAQQTI